MAGPLARPALAPDVPSPCCRRRTDEADDDEERRPPPPSERRPGRPRWRRQDDARGAAPVQAGAIPRLGRVDDGTAHLDFEPEEQKRRESLSLAVGTFESDGTRISLVDTPGYPGLHRRRGRGLRRGRRRDLRDGCLGAASRPAWRHAVALGRAGPGPRPASSSTSATARTPTRRAALDALRATLRQQDRAAPARDRRRRVVRGLRRPRPPQGVRAGTARPRSRSRSPTTSPTRSSRRRDQLLEAAAEADDDVLTKYLEGEEIADAELEACLRKGVKEIVLAPVLVGSATKGIGLRGLLDAIVRYLPSPADEPPVKTADKTGATVEVAADEAGPLLVRVFKTTADPFVGRLTYLRVLSGTLHSQAHVWNSTQGEDERIGQLLLLHGKEQEPIGELKAGEIGAVAKLTVTATGDTLGGAREAADPAGPRPSREPSLMVAIEPQSKGDLDKMGPALARMLEEEPTCRLERSATGEQVLRTMGEAHTVDHHRAAQAQVRGGHPDPHPEGAVQGDDPRHDQGPRPVQEADRRSRDVR